MEEAMLNNLRRTGFVVATVVALTAGLIVIPNIAASAAACKPVKPVGKNVGQIQVDAVKMPILEFMYPAGGVMEPQKSTLMAGLSRRHMPLSSTVGTSVVVWHRDYSKCVSALNILFKKSKGDRITLTDENGKVRIYQIQLKEVITKGDYKDSWFTLIGPRQIALFTCTGKFKNGHYENNLVLIAKPI
jgi:hypothetical protein